MSFTLASEISDSIAIVAAVFSRPASVTSASSGSDGSLEVEPRTAAPRIESSRRASASASQAADCAASAARTGAAAHPAGRPYVSRSQVRYLQTRRVAVKVKSLSVKWRDGLVALPLRRSAGALGRRPGVGRRVGGAIGVRRAAGVERRRGAGARRPGVWRSAATPDVAVVCDGVHHVHDADAASAARRAPAEVRHSRRHHGADAADDDGDRVLHHPRGQRDPGAGGRAGVAAGGDRSPPH